MQKKEKILSIPFTQTNSTITMKGPWESIAVGLEKGHKTQKLEKPASRYGNVLFAKGRSNVHSLALRR